MIYRRPKITIDEAIAVLTVLNFGRYSKAAEALNISQPALSVKVSNVEDKLGFRVIRASKGRGSSCSAYPAAKHFIKYCQELVKFVETNEQNGLKRGSQKVRRMLASRVIGEPSKAA